MNALASATVLCIFQLPAISGRERERAVTIPLTRAWPAADHGLVGIEGVDRIADPDPDTLEVALGGRGREPIQGAPRGQ